MGGSTQSASWQDVWLDRFYRARPGWRDGTTEFHEICRALVPKGGRILEVGAGPTNTTSAFLATLAELHGIDVDDEVRTNADVAASYLIQQGRYPIADSTFDVAVSNYVVEHVSDPDLHLSEISRILKPGGHYVFRTPNLLHYVALASRSVPHVAHKLMANRLRNLPADHHPPWPTVYAMNTPTLVTRYASRHGFTVERLDLVEKEPCYGLIARPLFLVFVAYERVVNASEALRHFRANMFVVLRKPGSELGRSS